MEITGATSVYGIIGDPVEHSLSPLFQQFFIARSQLDAVYVPFRVRAQAVAAAVTGLLESGVSGFNITVPHKQHSLSLVVPDADACKIGAVNTAKRGDGGWIATNTDWRGFASVMQGFDAGSNLAPVLLFGSGGTARAVLHALDHVGVTSILVCNRNHSHLQGLIAHAAASYPRLDVEGVAWSDEAVRGACRRVGMAVNTTSLGLSGEQSFPFALHGISSAIDVVYRRDGQTAFVKAARLAGARAVDGLSMLVAQGTASFHFWHGRQADGEGALRWLERRLGREPVISPVWDMLA